MSDVLSNAQAVLRDSFVCFFYSRTDALSSLVERGAFAARGRVRPDWSEEATFSISIFVFSFSFFFSSSSSSSSSRFMCFDV